MTDDKWPLEADFSDIRPMTLDERQAAKTRVDKNGWIKCVNCGSTSKDTWCSFCLEEE